MKIGAMVESFRLGFKGGVEKAASLGIEGIQAYATYGELAPENMTEDKIRETLDIVKSNGLVFSALCGDIGGYDDPNANTEKVARFKRILDLSKKLECGIVTTHIGKIPEDTTCVKYNTMFEACKSIADYAASIGATFAIETGPEKAIKLRGILEKVDTKSAKVNLDPANFVMVTGQDPAAAVRLLGKKIVHTHVKDGKMLRKTDPVIIYNHFAEGGIEALNVSDYFIETPVGSGDVAWDDYISALREIGYDGYLTIERETGENPAFDIKIAADFIRANKCL